MNSYGSAITARWYADTVRTIREAAGEPGLVVRNYGPDEFLAAAEQGGFDLSIASSGLTSLMISRTNGIPLLTIATNRAPDPNYGNGAAVVTRADRTDIRSLEDLEGMRVAVMSRTAFAGWQVPLVEMIRHGVNPAGFFGEVIETGAPMTRIVDAVRSGRADAGFLVTCLLEGLEDAGRLPPGELAVINEHHDGLIACRHSSTLYPNWLLTVKPGVSSELARRITERLLALPPGEDGIRWTVPTDHRRIYKLFSTLQMPLKSEAPLSWFMRTHWAWIFGGFLALLALVAHAAGLSALVRRRTRQAEAAVRARLASDLAARETALRLDALSRASAVGLISGMVAHELKQPLGVIGNYAGSLLRRLKRGDAVPNATLIEALEEIVRSDMSAADIVDRIRRWRHRASRALRDGPRRGRRAGGSQGVAPGAVADRLQAFRFPPRSRHGRARGDARRGEPHPQRPRGDGGKPAEPRHRHRLLRGRPRPSHDRGRRARAFRRGLRPARRLP